MSEDLTFGVAITGTGDGSMVEEAKAAQKSLEGLKTATEESSYSFSEMQQRLNASAKDYENAAEGLKTATEESSYSFSEMQQRLNASAKDYENAAARTWALANGYRDVGGSLVKYAADTEHAAAATEKGMFATAGAKRELIVLGHEAMQGNFSRIPGSLLVLAERLDLTAALFSPMTIGILGAGAAVVAIAEAAHDGAAELEAMNRALAMTGDYSGQTTDSLYALAHTLSDTTQLTIGQSKDLATQLAASGKIGADAFDGVAAAVAEYARATGESEVKVTPMMIKLFADPAKGAAKLNSTMHFLNSTQLDYIDTLEREGHITEAQLALADALNEKLKGQTREVGWLEAAWHTAAKAGSSFWDTLEGVGRADTTDEKIDKILGNIGLLNDSYMDADRRAAKIKVLEIELTELQAGKIKKQAEATVQAGKDEQQAYDTATLAIARQNSELWKKYEIQEKLARVTGGGSVAAPTDDAVMQEKTETEQEKSQKKILADAQRFDRQALDSHLDALGKWAEAWKQTEDLLTSLGASGAAARKQHEAAYTIYINAESEKRNAGAAANAKKQAEIAAEKAKRLKEHLAIQLNSENAYFEQVAAAADQSNGRASAREELRFQKALIYWEKRYNAAKADHKLTLAEEQAFQDALANIKKEHAAIEGQDALALVNIRKALRDGDFKDAMSMTMAMTAGIATHSRAAFEVNKIASLARATVSGYQMIQASATDGAEWGGYYGAIAEGALAAAFVVANLDAINSTQFGGGGSISTPSGGGGGIPSQATSPGLPVTPTNSGTGSQSNQNAQPVTVNIYNTGNLLSPDYIDTVVIAQIKDRIANADVTIIDPRSRQAQMLAAA
jgi:phage-related minor tail protein